MAAAGGLSVISGIAVGAFKFGGWAGRVDSDRTAFRDFMKEMREKIDKILERLPPPPAVASGSPVTLTERGRTISDALNAKTWASGQANKLLDTMRGKPEYEIHDLCVEHVQREYEEDNALHEEIRSGAYEHGIEVEQVQKVFAVELRDELLRRIEE